MKLRKLLGLAALCLSTSFPTFAQPTEPWQNEGQSLSLDQATGTFTYQWWGKSGRTYFIQSSENLVDWTYIPIIEPGIGDWVQWGFSLSGDKLFLRLKYSDITTSNAFTADFDGDNIGNWDELLQDSDPFATLDLNGNGIPDDWELFWDDQVGAFPKPITASLTHRESTTKQLYLNNPVTPDADFAVTVSNNLAGAQVVYDYEDSLTGSAIYNWTEISTTGTLLSNIADVVDGYEEVTLTGFTFPFYGTNYGSVFVSSNGMIAFGVGNSDWTNEPIPSDQSPDNFVAPFWDDHNTSTAGEVYFQELSDRLIVQYEGVAPYSGTGSYTYQAVLHSSGLIEFFYKEMEGNVESATVGLENANGTDGLEIAYNEPYIQDGLAVRISQGPAYFVKVSPLTGTTTTGATSALNVTFTTFGLAPGTYTADIDIAHTGTGSSPWNVPAVLEVTNPPSSISVQEPGEGQSFWQGDSVWIHAFAYDDDFGIDRVEFLVDGVIVDTDSGGYYDEYYGNWTASTAGTRVIVVRAVDIHGAITESEPITVTVRPDSDSDGMDDDWEILHFGDLSQTADGDFDGDSVSNLAEYEQGTNPTTATDSDTDGMPDDWELAHELEIGANDGNLDKDNDGLTNLLEYQAGTNPSYFDTDGDLLPDGFEYYSAQLDPLVPNALDDDLDNDGLTTFEELTHGTNPDLWDTDGDGISDGDEAAVGADPTDPGSMPFDPVNFYGPPLSDANAAPVGDLGTGYGSDPTKYEITGQIGDGSGSHSERWRFNIGSKQISSEQFGVIDDFEMVLNDREIFDVTLSHVATNEEDGPDYDYTATISPSGFILSDLDGLLGTYGNQGDSDYWSHKTAYLIPVAGSGWSDSYSGGDAVGPRYRKVTLNGRPRSDEQPQQEAETESVREETYVDAFDLSLRHDTSYVYVPLAASDLVLQAAASVRETGWSDRGGLRPAESLTLPFGVGWSSNLSSYIEIVEVLGDNTSDPVTVNVIDEQGHSQRFGTEDFSEFFPWPSSRTDRKTYLNQLALVGGELILTKKFGTRLTFRPSEAWFMYSTDRVDGSDKVRKHTYWRLEEVEDRYGSRIVYDYGTSGVSLIPERIEALDRTDQWIVVVRSADARRVEAVTDARGNTITFDYSQESVSAAGDSLTYPYYTLDEVHYPDGTSKSYTYEAVSDQEVVDGDTTWHYHANLTSITDKRGNTHSFAYQFDRTKEYFSGNGGRAVFAVDISGLPGDVQDDAEAKLAEINEEGDPGDPGSYKRQYGLPRQITSVTLPGGIGTSTFAKTPETLVRFGPEFSATSGTVVTDTIGNQTTYTFHGVEGEIVDRDTSFSGGSTAVSVEWMIYYTSMTVDHAGLGTETFVFDLPSGLSLASMTDFSGNTTTWTFDDPLPPGRITPILASEPSFMTTWSDPTTKTDALGRVESYQYGPWRVMSQVNDVHGTVTEWTVDSLGRRKATTVTDASGTLLRSETFTYDDEDGGSTSFGGFLSEKRVVAYSNLSGQPWEQDIVTQYVPDSRARLWKEIIAPGSLALTTEHAYDLNNNRTSTVNPRGHTTVLTYDALNRLVKVTNPAAGTSGGTAQTTVRRLYDARGNLACEVDEEGRYTLHHHDDLGRRIRTIRDIDGLGLPTLPAESAPQVLAESNRGTATAADLVTEFTYNAVNSLESTTDPRGFVTRNFYDAIQRVRHTYTHFQSGDANADGTENGSTVAASSEKTHTEFLYQTERNPGASGFSTEGFKPTQIIRHDAVRGISGLQTLNSHFFYDADYRETQKQVEYAPGNFATTTTAYGTISGGKETLVSSVTDPLGKVTRTVRDGLGRVTEVRDAYNTPDEILTQTSFSSTGFGWLVIDPRGHHTESEFDAAGRVVKVWQPDPVTGLINRQPADDSATGSPVTETIYDAAGNVTATINPRGDRWDFTYDARNRKTREEAPAVADASQSGSPVIRPVTQIFHDGVGNIIQTIDPRLASTVTDFDNANRPVTVTTAAVPVFGVSGNQQLVSTNLYDKGGNVVRAIDFEGNRTINFYDALGRLTASATNPVTGQPSETAGSPHADDILVSYQYDDAGNRTLVIDGEGAQTAFRYDGLSRNTQTIWDIGADLERIKTVEYNAALMVRRTDEKGQVTEYDYDGLHRLEDVLNLGRSVDNRHYDYDANGNVLAVTYPNDLGTPRAVAQTYDALNRVSTETSAGVTHSYTYDKAGNRLSATYGQTSRQLVSTYDALNRLATATEGTRVTTYGYDLAGNIVEKELPNGVTVTSTFDLLGRKKTSTNTAAAQAQPFVEFLYGHDRVGNVRQIEENYPLGNLPDRTVTNTYDHTYRLDTEIIAVSGGSTTTTAYGYDDAHNRASKSVTVAGGAPTVTTYTYGDGSTASGGNSNQLVSFTEGANTVTFTYDANGNRATRTENGQTDTYSYDYENRLLGLDYQTGSSDTGLYGYAYDHRTRRVVRDESAITGRDLSLIVFSSGTSVQEHTTSISSNPAVEYIRGSDYGGGIGGILYTLRSGIPSFNHYNSRGDVVAKTDSLGALSWQAQYEAFGTRTTEVGTNPDRQKANTKDEDPTGLLNEGFRYRDLETGTFITRDPLGFVDGPNVYTYVVQNPWTFFDPLGLQNGAKRNKPPTDQMFYPRLAHSIFVKPFVEAQRAGQVHLEHAAVEAGDGNIGMTVSHTAAALFHAVSTAVVEIGPGKVVKGADTINDVRKGVDATVDLSRGADGLHDMQRAADGATDLNAANRTAETADTAGDSAQVTRYMGKEEAEAAANSGAIPNTGPPPQNLPRPTHVTTDSPLDSASEAQKAYELPVKPTHRATVPRDRVNDLGPAPDGRPTTSGGGSQSATNEPIPVKPEEIIPLED